jgi:DNA-binding transcriptional MerR regulator
MELQTISYVSRNYGISTRMLRYYEQAGLINSLRKDDYAYRVYDDNALKRLQQIIILRKLRIPVKQIISILNNNDGALAVEIFMQNIREIDQEITALNTVRSILMRFVKDIKEKAHVDLKLLDDEAVFSVVDSLSFSHNKIKEVKEAPRVEELNNANEELMKITDKDVRIIFLPPMTVAAAHVSGEDCEDKSLDMISKFTRDSGLLDIKPDARSFGFDCSEGPVEFGEKSQAYEVWVSVPHNMEIPAPLIKREFSGGLYAAHVLRAWDFQDWHRLKEWVDTSELYENDWGTSRCASVETSTRHGLEETLNFYNFVRRHNSEMSYLQLDLLFPIKEKENGK